MEPTDKIIPIAENLFWIKPPGKGKFPFCNGFLITGNETVLIDAGIGEQMIKTIDAQKRIDSLVISHSHPDHFFHWYLLKDRHIFMPRETPDVIQDLMQLARRLTKTEENAIHWKKRIGDVLGVRALRLPDSRFEDGDIIDFGEIKLEAIHAPGHLDDHYCFLVRDAGILLTTDIDFDSFGPWYGNPESNIALFKQSIEKVRRYPFEMVISSHKPPIKKEDAQQAFDAYLAIFDRQQKLILDQCVQPKSVLEMVKNSPIYHNKLDDIKIQRIFEERMIRKILADLSDAGLIEQSGEIFSCVKTN